MIKTSELGHLVLALIILSFVASWSFFRELSAYAFGLSFLLFIIILGFNTFFKKLVAYFYDTETEIKIWHLERYGMKERQYFRTPIPMGILVPFVLAIASLGIIPWYASLQYNVTPLKYRASRKHDYYSFSELTEFHIGMIAGWAFVANLAVALIAYLINLPELAKLSIFYVAFNMLPISKLDGCKLFFGSQLAYFIIAAITVIGLAFALIL
ncbi:MAG: hypothetical protein ABIE22_04430 [archaeon]